MYGVTYHFVNIFEIMTTQWRQNAPLTICSITPEKITEFNYWQKRRYFLRKSILKWDGAKFNEDCIIGKCDIRDTSGLPNLVSEVKRLLRL